MSQPANTRLHPIAALRAMRNLMRDREDTRQRLFADRSAARQDHVAATRPLPPE